MIYESETDKVKTCPTCKKAWVYRHDCPKDKQDHIHQWEIFFDGGIRICKLCPTYQVKKSRMKHHLKTKLTKENNK